MSRVLDKIELYGFCGKYLSSLSKLLRHRFSNKRPTVHNSTFRRKKVNFASALTATRSYEV